MRLLAAEYVILVRYHFQTATASALYESTHGSAGRPADNPSNSGELGDLHRTLPETMVQVNLQPRPPIWLQFGLDPDPDLKQRSGTIAITPQDTWLNELIHRQSGGNNIYSWMICIRISPASQKYTDIQRKCKGYHFWNEIWLVLEWSKNYCFYLQRWKKKTASFQDQSGREFALM